jgi:hypothetical protein
MKIRNILVVVLAMLLLCANYAEAAKLAPYGPFRALDADANPLDGGLLYTYEAGTTTPKATYTDSTGNVANANPVVLDSSGYANVWLDDGSYKFVLKNSDDVTQWTIDNIVGDSTNAFGSQVVSSASNLAITDAYANAVVIATAIQTHSLPPAASVGSGFYYVVKNSSGTLTIDPDGSETIDGAASLTIPAGVGGLIITNGTAWFSDFVNAKNAATADTATTVSSTLINALTAKTSIVDADQLAMADSAASNVNKKITWANTKTQIRTDMPSSTSQTGFVELATDAEVTTGTDTARVPPVSAINSHKGAAKAWYVGQVSGGTLTSQQTYNSSMVRNSTGDFTVTFATAFANNFPAGACMAQRESTDDNIICAIKQGGTVNSTTYPIRCVAGGSNTAVDPSYLSCVWFGLQ